jgi:hypothetical protein
MDIVQNSDSYINTYTSGINLQIFLKIFRNERPAHLSGTREQAAIFNNAVFYMYFISFSTVPIKTNIMFHIIFINLTDF